MTAARTLLVAIGVALAGLVALGVVLRAVGVSAVSLLERLPAPAFYAGAAALLFLALLLMLHTPASRKKERRVQLSDPVTRDRLARPAAASAALPKTSGVRSGASAPAQARPAEAEAAAARPAAAHAAQERRDAQSADGANAAHPGSGTQAAMANGAPTARTQPAPQLELPAAAPEPVPAMALPEPPRAPPLPVTARREADTNTTIRKMRRREELEQRLEVLQQKAGAVKVSFGLGRISSAGYRQYLKEVDQERTLIEAELMSIHDD